MTDNYAVIGNPVAHSKSPLIHAEFARRTGQDISYTRILAPLDGFRSAALEFRDQGGRGLNVTLPFKHDAWTLADVHSGDALNARAVNTIEFKDDKIIGHNTDGVGLVRDITVNLQCPIKGKRVLLMGAGGASHGVMERLLREQPRELVVANRTVEKAVALVARFDRLPGVAAVSRSARGYDGLGRAPFDIVVDATSAGLSDAMPPLPPDLFAPDALAYEMVYGRSTPFRAFARARGAKVSDGTGMLVEQAAESFLIWRGVRPDTAPVIAMLRKA